MNLYVNDNRYFTEIGTRCPQFGGRYAYNQVVKEKDYFVIVEGGRVTSRVKFEFKGSKADIRRKLNGALITPQRPRKDRV